MAVKRLLAAGIFGLLDITSTAVILAHGNHWNIFLESIRDRYVSTTGFDFFLLSILRFGLLTGAVIGILWNPRDAPKRIGVAENYLMTFGIVAFLYFFTKLLIYSEQPEFLSKGSAFEWFWISFGWNLFATAVTVLVFSILSKAGVNADTVAVDASDKVVDERTPLLNKQLDEDDSTIGINDPTGAALIDDRASSSSDTSTSGLSDNEEDKGEDKKNKKDEEKKSFSELANKATLMKMLSYSRKDLRLIMVAVFFLLGAALAETFIPLFTGKVISGIAIDQDYEKFTKNIVIMCLITIVAAVCAGLRGGLTTLAVNRFNMRIRNTLFQSLTKQEIGFFDMNKTGDMISRLTSDTSTMSDMIGLNCNIFLRSVVKGAGTCVVMFSLSWRLTIITFMGLPLVLAVAKLYGNYYKKLQILVQDAYALANEVAEEVVSSMRTVRSFANESGENKRYEEKMLYVYNVQKKQALAYAGFVLSIETAVLALVTGTLWYGGHLVLNHLMNSQNLIAFILYQITLGDCMASIGSVYTGLMQALGAAEKVFKLIDREPKIEINKGDLTPAEFEGRVSFDNVTFAYPSRPNQNVLKNVSFEAPPGQVTALVGPSGGGKSTCINLLQYFYGSVSGCIRIDGNPVEKYSHKYLHQKISLVGQEPVLYARSIKENIAYGMEEHEHTMTDVVEVARIANAHSFITELVDQYETETGEKGTQLSGGQKQRVAIARALLRNPKILILDEATSALDTESEYLVQQALQKTMNDRTVVVIAHRLSTVETADKIVVIDKGRVLEEGTHADLMKRSGMYYKLVHRQLHREHHKRERKRTESSKHREKSTGLSTSVGKSLDIPQNNLLRTFSVSSSLGSERSVLYDSDNIGSDGKPSSLKML